MNTITSPHINVITPQPEAYPGLTPADMTFLSAVENSSAQDPFGLAAAGSNAIAPAATAADRFAGVTDALKPASDDLHRLSVPLSTEQINTSRATLDKAGISREQVSAWKETARMQYESYYLGASVMQQIIAAEQRKAIEGNDDEDDEDTLTTLKAPKKKTDPALVG